MTEHVLALNAGSSSLKFGLYADAEGHDGLREVLRGTVETHAGSGVLRATDANGQTVAEDTLAAPAGEDQERTLEAALGAVETHAGAPPRVIGHRVVHGGSRFTAATRLDDAALEALAGLEPLAPGHQPFNLAIVDHARKRYPDAVHVGCFDTAFHHTCPAVARRYALPERYTRQGVVRFGFHGLSYEYIAGAAPAYLSADARRLVVAHLGHGASLCALDGGRSVATTMGFTALDGLPMGTRCGSLDPGVVLWLLEAEGLTPAEASELLHRRSGLLGVSGISDDMRELLASDAAEAAIAIELFVYRAALEIGALTAALGGIDALVFTGGMGAGSPEVRRRICARLAWFGVELDHAANQAGNTRIAAHGATVDVLALVTDEERVIARQARASA